MDKIILWILNFMTLYAFIPGLLSRLFGYRVFKKGQARRELALTFDDGPDEIYTDQLLDLLKQYNAKATFFVVGSHAEQYPDVVRRMKAEGHTIGIHNYTHKMNWVMLPKTVKKQIEQTNEIIYNITGQYTHYYRPPWGVVNLFDFARVKEFNIVLWSGIFGDWQRKLGPEKLKAKMLKKMKPGAVFLLHDSGNTLGADSDAPANMLIALKEILEIGTAKDYKFVTIDQLQSITNKFTSEKPSAIKKLTVKVWLLYEGLVHKVLRLNTIKGYTTPFFHYRLVKHTGKSIHLNDGNVVNKGDLVAELHFDNTQLSSIAFQSKSMLTTALRLIKETERNLPLLAHEICSHPQKNDIKAVMGITMINRGADRLGFEIVELEEGIFAKVTRIYLKILMKVLTPTKKKALQKSKHDGDKQDMEPRIVVLGPSSLKQWDETYRTLFANSTEVAATQHS